MPGGSAKHPKRRWPAERFAELAEEAIARGLAVGIVAGPDEKGIGREITRDAPDVVDLTARTDLLQLAALGAQASFAVGNDTGPMHLLAAAGAPSLVLFSAESDPDLRAPRGRGVVVLRATQLQEINVEEALRTMRVAGAFESTPMAAHA